MSSFWLLRFVFVAIVSLVSWTGMALADSTLPDAVKKADAKYLDLKETETEDNSKKIEAGGGEEDTEPTAQEISEGTLKAALSYTESKSEEGDETMHAPVVTVTFDGKEIEKFEGDPGFGDPPVSVQIANLDPGNPHPEVIVSFYTGGAHCCSDTKILTSSKDGSSWQTVDLGQFDGGPLTATDIDGDGVHEFETRDNAFLYTFGCYACSSAPLMVLTVQDGAVKNITTDPRFHHAHELWLKDMITDVPEEDVNGFLAGYVGEKILLGEGKPAWELMLAHYDKESDWGLETCPQPVNEQGECSVKTELLSFPDALERMLNENGYKVEK
jgi:hypothetical protein